VEQPEAHLWLCHWRIGQSARGQKGCQGGLEADGLGVPIRRRWGRTRHKLCWNVSLGDGACGFDPIYSLTKSVGKVRVNSVDFVVAQDAGKVREVARLAIFKLVEIQLAPCVEACCV